MRNSVWPFRELQLTDGNVLGSQRDCTRKKGQGCAGQQPRHVAPSLFIWIEIQEPKACHGVIFPSPFSKAEIKLLNFCMVNVIKTFDQEPSLQTS